MAVILVATKMGFWMRKVLKSSTTSSIDFFTLTSKSFFFSIAGHNEKKRNGVSVLSDSGEARPVSLSTDSLFAQSTRIKSDLQINQCRNLLNANKNFEQPENILTPCACE